MIREPKPRFGEIMAARGVPIMPSHLIALLSMSLVLLPVAGQAQDRGVEALTGTPSVRPDGNHRAAEDRTVGVSPSSQLNRQEDRVIVEDRAAPVIRRTCLEVQRDCADVRR
jgi:hypothetical protein